MNKLFKGLAVVAAASSLCVCPINAGDEDNKNSTKPVVVQSQEDKPSQLSIIWNAGLLGKLSIILAAGCILETGYIVADKVFGVFNN